MQNRAARIASCDGPADALQDRLAEAVDHLSAAALAVRAAVDAVDHVDEAALHATCERALDTLDELLKDLRGVVLTSLRPRSGVRSGRDARPDPPAIDLPSSDIDRAV